MSYTTFSFFNTRNQILSKKKPFGKYSKGKQSRRNNILIIYSRRLKNTAIKKQSQRDRWNRIFSTAITGSARWGIASSITPLITASVAP